MVSMATRMISPPALIRFAAAGNGFGSFLLGGGHGVGGARVLTGQMRLMILPYFSDD